MITEFYWFNTGYTTGYEWLTKGAGSWKKLKFPAYCGLLKDDKHGYILFDTGYGPYFRKATARWPYRLYRWMTPIYYHEDRSVLSHLERKGIKSEMIRYVFVSHFHADHIGYLRAFEQAQFIFHEEVMDLIELSPFAQVKNGFLPELLPKQWNQHAHILRPETQEIIDDLGSTWTLFDGVCRAVYLPGHAKGQLGLYFEYDGRLIFLVADAAWLTSAITTQSRPHALVNLIMDQPLQYNHSIDKINRWLNNHPQAIILPTHCTEINHPFKIDQ